MAQNLMEKMSEVDHVPEADSGCDQGQEEVANHTDQQQRVSQLKGAVARDFRICDSAASCGIARSHTYLRISL
jgi:hypothetical protein